MKTPSDGYALEVRDLKMYFPVTAGLLRRKVADVKAVDGVSFATRPGETLGLVGESGCGKTTVGRCIVRLYRPTAGEIIFEGKDISRLPEREIRPLRRRMNIVFQDPFGSLDPRQSIGSIVGDPLKRHRLVQGKTAYRDRVAELFEMVGLDSNLTGRYPHELSGGQRQRVAVARALAGDPSLIVCDEPVSALDVSIQAQTINLLRDLQRKIFGLTYIFISHDLWVVQYISTRVAVMYLGRIVETAGSRQLYENPMHPYTKALLSAAPVCDPELESARQPIVLQGETPSALNPPSGCRFHPRCPMAQPECREKDPVLRSVGEDHEAACLLI
ncbi:MAG: ABC transporter ATP-binding protein [Thermoleophilia bacterium]|nr:ABC transporter ATP-binding protein [Thermoleophilia bacterium]